MILIQKHKLGFHARYEVPIHRVDILTPEHKRAHFIEPMELPNRALVVIIARHATLFGVRVGNILHRRTQILDRLVLSDFIQAVFD